VPLVDVDPAGCAPRSSGVGEFDRVLAGGLVDGSVTLLFGEPGIGKSTLLLQVLSARAARGDSCLLVSAEESAPQVRARAARLGPLSRGLLVASTADVEDAERALVALRPDVMVVDSVQTVGDATVGGPPGTLTQVRACVERLTRPSREMGTALVLVGHVTKAGDVAGPRALEHLVDTVLGFDGDRHHSLRVLRAVKHRFGPTGEMGLFEMGDAGLQDVEDPGALLLGDRRTEVAGSIVAPLVQGRRAILVELQALACGRDSGSTETGVRQSAQGVDPQRLALVLAVLRSRTDLDLRGAQVFTSAAGGISATEPGTDLPLALAVNSAVTSAVLPADLVAFGEIGLAGEVRNVPHVDRRLAESARLGFSRALVPASTPEGSWPIEAIRVSTVAGAIRVVERLAPGRRGSRRGAGDPRGEACRATTPGTIPVWSTARPSR
jgi:DNA repair protein RadA/Sms